MFSRVAPAPVSVVASKIMNLSQLLIIGLPADNDIRAVRELQPGGVVFMGRNAATPSETRRLVRSINQELEIPALVCTDQEGGRVQRFKDGFAPIPPAREVGRRGARAVEIAGMDAAAELRGAGINWNFAPVCDVPTHADDTVIGARAFSDNPIRAGVLAAQYVRGAQPNILACAKHFPGHGGVGVDSHKSLPTFSGTRAELEPHLTPFRAAMAAGVASIMVGHISVPCLDASGTPASLSAPIITGLLRDEMNYRGLVVTDDLEMGALNAAENGNAENGNAENGNAENGNAENGNAENGAAGAIAVKALAAGCDMLLWCHNSEKARLGLRAIERALDDGTLETARVEDAIERVAWAKERFGVAA